MDTYENQEQGTQIDRCKDIVVKYGVWQRPFVDYPLHATQWLPGRSAVKDRKMKPLPCSSVLCQGRPPRWKIYPYSASVHRTTFAVCSTSGLGMATVSLTYTSIFALPLARDLLAHRSGFDFLPRPHLAVASLFDRLDISSTAYAWFGIIAPLLLLSHGQWLSWCRNIFMFSVG